MQLMILFARHPDKETVSPGELGQAEFEKVRGLYMDGFVRQIWLRVDQPGACMIVEASSIDQAADKVAALPLVRAGFLQVPTIIPLQPYAGFAPGH